MDTYKLDIYLNEVNRDFLNKATFATLFRSRKLGFHSAADLFCEAFKEFDDTISSDFISTIEVSLACRKFISQYNISYKNDILFMISHPDMVPVYLDKGQKTVKKKVFQFFDIEEPGMEYKLKAFNTLNDIKPIMRAHYIDKVTRQYFVLNENDYYFTQLAARIMNNLLEIAAPNAKGEIEGISKDVIDIVWKLSDYESE